jgi:CBS domain-containing protein
MKIEEILRTKGHEVVTIEESRSVLEAAQLLVERNIGGLVVTDGTRTTGILTERDILRLAARSPGELGTTQVSTEMTREVITASPEDRLAHAMGVMTENKVRHLPVMVGAELAGIVSIGDLLHACRVVAEAENTQLREYIQSGG